MAGFGAAIRTCCRRGLTFSGRAARPEFWYFALFVVLCLALAAGIDATMFARSDVLPATGLALLVAFVPLLAAAWRRMHDTGRSGLFAVYPAIVAMGLGFYLDLVAGPEATALDALAGPLFGAGDPIASVASVVLVLSPLLVLWWLSRPGQPVANKWGPPPR